MPSETNSLPSIAPIGPPPIAVDKLRALQPNQADRFKQSATELIATGRRAASAGKLRFKALKLHREIHGLATAVNELWRELGAQLLESGTKDLPIDEERQMLAEAIAGIDRNIDRLKVLEDTRGTSSLAREVNREIRELQAKRDDALNRIGRKACSLESGNPALRQKINDLEKMLDEQRVKLSAMGSEFVDMKFDLPTLGGSILERLRSYSRLQVLAILAGIAAIVLLGMMLARSWGPTLEGSWDVVAFTRRSGDQLSFIKPPPGFMLPGMTFADGTLSGPFATPVSYSIDGDTLVINVQGTGGGPADRWESLPRGNRLRIDWVSFNEVRLLGLGDDIGEELVLRRVLKP